MKLAKDFQQYKQYADITDREKCDYNLCLSGKDKEREREGLR